MPFNSTHRVHPRVNPTCLRVVLRSILQQLLIATVRSGYLPVVCLHDLLVYPPRRCCRTRHLFAFATFALLARPIDVFPRCARCRCSMYAHPPCIQACETESQTTACKDMGLFCFVISDEDMGCPIDRYVLPCFHGKSNLLGTVMLYTNCTVVASLALCREMTSQETQLEISGNTILRNGCTKDRVEYTLSQTRTLADVCSNFVIAGRSPYVPVVISAWDGG